MSWTVASWGLCVLFVSAIIVSVISRICLGPEPVEVIISGGSMDRLADGAGGPLGPGSPKFLQGIRGGNREKWRGKMMSRSTGRNNRKKLH